MDGLRVTVENAKVLTVIPARLESSRLPQKMLATIHGKPMIYWVARRVRRSKVADFVVATDSQKIARVCDQAKLPFVMTSPDCRNGTERVYEVATLKPEYSHFLNVQGDEPLINLRVLDRMLRTVGENDGAFKTAVSALNANTNNPAEIKVAMQSDNRIRYASRSHIPFSRDQVASTFKIVGVYLYSRRVLEDFVNAPVGDLERLEQVEQLRCIENDLELLGVECESSPKSIDTQEDLDAYRALPMRLYR